MLLRLLAIRFNWTTMPVSEWDLQRGWSAGPPPPAGGSTETRKEDSK